jgi:hypothetical protein
VAQTIHPLSSRPLSTAGAGLWFVFMSSFSLFGFCEFAPAGTTRTAMPRYPGQTREVLKAGSERV